MPRRATKRVQRNKRTKTRRGGALKAAALGLGALATGAYQPLGQGQTALSGPGPYAMGRPFPTRNRVGLNVYPTPTPSAGPGSMGRIGTHQYVNEARHANEHIWPTPTPGPAVKGWFDPAPGTRYIAPPEVQTWNPYLRGDPDEVVDYYEGYSQRDKTTREAADAEAGTTRDPVIRRDTPMWKAAEAWSLELPSTHYSTYNPIQWEAYARKGRELGMNVPLEDPRVAATPNANWAAVPARLPRNILQSQLYHSQRGPVPGMGLSNKGKGGINLPRHWTNSALSSPWPTNRNFTVEEQRSLLAPRFG